MTRSSHDRDAFAAGLMPINSISNAIGLASFHSSPPMTPSITGGDLQGEDLIDLGSGSARATCTKATAARSERVRSSIGEDRAGLGWGHAIAATDEASIAAG